MRRVLTTVIGSALVVFLNPLGHPSGRPELAEAASAPGRESATALSQQPVAFREGWRELVQSPPTRDVAPIGLVSVEGSVLNPEALLGGSGVATLSFNGIGDAPVLILDYGKEIGGFARYDVASATPGVTVHSGFSETLEFLTKDGDAGGVANGLFQSGAVNRYEDVTLTGPGMYAGPLVQGGQRYQYLTLSQPGTVQLRGVNFRYTGYLGTPDRLTGNFMSNDPLLNKIWYAGVYTLNINQVPAGMAQLPGYQNDLNLIIDGGKRDRAPWTGDQLVASPTAFYSVPLQYPRDTLKLLGSRPGTEMALMAPAVGDPSVPGPMPGVCSPHTSPKNCMMYSDTYSMMYVLGVRNYLLYSGDLAFAREAWPLVVRQMRWNEQHVGEDGLYSVEPAGANNWNLELKPGVQTYVNGVYRETLLAAAAIGEAIGETSQVAAWREAAARVKSAVNERFYNASTGAYDPNADNRGVVVQDANVQAVLSGIATDELAKTVLDTLARKLDTSIGRRSIEEPAPDGYIVRYSPFMGSLNLQAEFEAGSARRAVDYIRTFWGRMVESDPGNVIWERPDANGRLTSGDSAAHAWSTGPTWALSRYVLGVEPVTEGFDRWSVRPHLSGLGWAQGQIPTPHGRIQVVWRRTSEGGFVMTVDSPSGTRGFIDVPLLGAPRVIARNGRVVWNGAKPLNTEARVEGDFVRFDVTGGGVDTYAWSA